MSDPEDTQHPVEEMVAILLGQIQQVDDDNNVVGPVVSQTPAEAVASLAKLFQKLEDEIPE
jgi:hypothetical protein